MQIQACRDYFKREECQFEAFVDEGFSGANTDRPAFIRMKNKIKNGEFDIVVVYKIDRISRNMVDFINLVDNFEKYNVRLVSVTEGADPSTPSGRFVMNILASVAEMERANTVQRVTDNMLMMAKHGRWTGGNVPIGYRSVKKENGVYLAVDEHQRDLVLDIFNTYLQVESLNEVSRIFNINVASISDMLSSPVYVESTPRVHEYLKINGFQVFNEPNGCGYLTYGKRPKKNNRKLWNTKGYIVAVSKHEALIDEDTWLKVQELLKKKSIEPRPKDSKHSYLNQLVKCAKCGSNMIIDSNYTRVDGTKVYSFMCGARRKNSTACTNGSVMVSELEKAIEKQLRQIGTSKSTIKDYLNMEAPNNHIKDKNKIKNQIRKNKMQIDNLTDKLALISNDAAMPLIRKIEELTQLNKNLQSELLLIEKMESQISGKNKVDKLYNNIKLFNEMQDAYVEEKRKIIREIIEKITFDKEKNIARITLKT